MKLSITPNTVNNNIEKYIVSDIKKMTNLIEFFSDLDNNSCDVIIKKIKNKFNVTLKYPYQIINSIKSAYTKSDMINNHYKLENNKKNIYDVYSKAEKIFKTGNDYNNPIKNISEKYNLSPLNIMRLIIKIKYSEKITKINRKKISKFDNAMIDYSTEHDKYALIDGNKIMSDALQFEKDIEKILKKLGVKYKTQDELTEEQIKKYGKAINTPDFLILSDFYINNVKINWIDAKKFYGSCIGFVKKKIKQQTIKYISEFGTGSIIYSLGFNKNQHFDNIILIDYDSFKDASN